MVVKPLGPASAGLFYAAIGGGKPSESLFG